jgi:hypothetical protein
VRYDRLSENPEMNAAIAETIIEAEKNDYKFEQFATELCSMNEGVTFVPTSKSWDRGRDARSTAPGRGTHRHILCATLNRDINSKVDSDLLRVTATSSPDRLIYCSSQRLSEEKVDEITQIIRRHAPSGSLLVLGSIQLGSLAEKYPEIFEKHYHAEVTTIRANLTAQPDQKSETRGLRLALVTFSSDDAAVLRREILHRAVLDHLLVNKETTADRIVEDFSKDLGLPKPMRKETILTVLDQERVAGTARQEQGHWALTEAGRKLVVSPTADAAGFLLEGRQLVRDEAEGLLGQKMADLQYEQFWSALLDFLSALFYTNGLATIRAVEGVLSEKPEGPTEDASLRELLIEGAQKISLVASTPDTRQSLAQAVLDMFSDRSSAAFDWLTRISERFVILCSLGLESTSSNAIRELLRKCDLILDSDIILTYLCQAEPDHKAATELMARWIQFGGKVLLSPVVLEEVAHHAWISQRDFRETEHLLGKLQGNELRRYIDNAFVRTYYTLEKTGQRWDLFIGQFRGNASNDYTKVLASLRSRFPADLLPDTSDPDLENKVKSYLMSAARRTSGADVLEDRMYKIDRDARLVASVAAGRIARQKAGDDRFQLLLTSSGQIRRAEHKFRTHLGGAKTVISLASFSYLVSMVPDLGLSADALRRALFEFGASARLRDTERRALRVIRSTEDYDIPWASRGLLLQELENGIRSEAEKLGVNEEELRRTLDNGRNPGTSARLIAGSLKKMAVTPEDIEKYRRAERRIQELEEELAETQNALRSTRKVPPKPPVVS